jgi:hypothetical protein
MRLQHFRHLLEWEIGACCTKAHSEERQEEEQFDGHFIIHAPKIQR